jgi:hypothetical protein
MQSNRLQLNADNTDVMWCASARRAPSLPSDPVIIAGADVQPVPTVRDLSVLIDSDFSAASHVRLIVGRCFAALPQLWQLRRYVGSDCFRSLVIALIHTRLDYGNFILVGPQRSCTFGVPSSSSRSHYRLACHLTLAPHSRTCRLQACGHGV